MEVHFLVEESAQCLLESNVPQLQHYVHKIGSFGVVHEFRGVGLLHLSQDFLVHSRVVHLCHLDYLVLQL